MSRKLIYADDLDRALVALQDDRLWKHGSAAGVAQARHTLHDMPAANPDPRRPPSEVPTNGQRAVVCPYSPEIWIGFYDAVDADWIIDIGDGKHIRLPMSACLWWQPINTGPLEGE